MICGTEFGTVIGEASIVLRMYDSPVLMCENMHEYCQHVKLTQLWYQNFY